MISYPETLGEILRDVRKKQKQTLREVSSKGNIALGYLSDIETGRKEPSGYILQRICYGLNIEFWWLLQAVSNELKQQKGNND
jgi:transcriptional regulator with XRE-family HTH domain